MKIEVQVDETYPELKVIVQTNKMTDEVEALVRKLSAEDVQLIAGFKDESVVVLDPSEIYRIFAQSGKVLAETDHGTYHLRLRLYEVEELLNKWTFVRISNSDMINLNKVKRFDFSFTGTIYVQLSNGKEVYASRRYVAKIKELLGLRGSKK